MADCKIKVSFFFLLLVGALINPAYAATIEVRPGGSIQNAIDQAVSGDTVFLFSGTYAEDVVMKDGIDLAGESYNLVVINGRISFQNSSSTLRDITVCYPEGGFLSYADTYYNGLSLQDDAGITIINSAPVIRDCLIMPDLDNIIPAPEHYGKGIQIWNMYNSSDASPEIANNVITGAEYGIYYFSQVFGGAVLGQVKNNTLYRNKNGIVLRMHEEKPEIKNSIIAGGESGLFVTYGDGALFDERKALVHHNDIWGVLYKYWLDENSSEFDLTGIGANISADPLFADPGGYDFSLDTGSPCIGQADDGGNMGARLIPRPHMPTAEPIDSPTNKQFITIEGTKDAGTSIIINGVERVPLSAENEWTISFYDLGADGNKTLTISAKNASGRESTPVAINVTLDTVAPVIEIASPLEGAEITTAPITVLGTINEPCDVIVDAVLAASDGITFAAENVNLKYGSNTITARAYDLAGNSSTDTATVTSTVTSDYQLIKLTEDIFTTNPEIPPAGSQITLEVKLLIEGSPASGEPIDFNIISGSGSLEHAQVSTDVDGIAADILTLGINTSELNRVEAYAANCPSEKVFFTIATVADIPNQLIKITDESVAPVPVTTIPLVVKLVDINSNIIQGEELQFSILSGGGSLSSATAITGDQGEAKVYFTTAAGYGQISQIEAKVTSAPTILTVFSITTSQSAPSATADQIMALVAANDALIQDVMADIHVTSNAPWMAPVSDLKIWIKGNKQKVQEISPNPGVYIRPPIAGSISFDKEIISYDPATNVYAIKLKKTGQVAEYPYMVNFIDYTRGLTLKIEHHILENNYETTCLSEYSDFIQLNGVWGYRTQIDKIYGPDGTLIYTTTNAYSNIQINTGIPDSVF